VPLAVWDAQPFPQVLAASERQGGNFKEIFSLATLELWHRAFA
jgi:hypothetical protein